MLAIERIPSANKIPNCGFKKVRMAMNGIPILRTKLGKDAVTVALSATPSILSLPLKMGVYQTYLIWG